MKKNDALALYHKYHTDHDFDRIGLFKALNEKYNIESALYPGSFVHITPSFLFPKVVYVDSFKKTQAFFDNEDIYKFINDNKEYKSDSSVTFHKSDYRSDFGEAEQSFDLLLSQYAGFISQACKKYLKIGGILVTNNSHGDASMAYLDPDFELIAIYDKRTNDKYSIKDNELEKYFIPKSDKAIVTKAHLEKTNRGIGYTKSPTGYIFKRLS